MPLMPSELFRWFHWKHMILWYQKIYNLQSIYLEVRFLDIDILVIHDAIADKPRHQHGSHGLFSAADGPREDARTCRPLKGRSNTSNFLLNFHEFPWKPIDDMRREAVYLGCFGCYTPQSLTVRPWKVTFPIGKIAFQPPFFRGYVKLVGCSCFRKWRYL